MQLHASCVAFAGQGVLICGASGSGKSSLALELMGLGAALVADDKTDIKWVDDWPVAISPDAIAGKIEARGVGILAAEHAQSARLRLVVDLDQTETDRLPPDRRTDLFAQPIPMLHKVESRYFASAIRLYVTGGKVV